MANRRKQGTTALKFAFSALLVYLVFTKVDFKEVWGILKGIDPLFLLCALLFFVVSKILSAYRLNLYFHELGIFLSHRSNLRLYLLGMFYNLFLPGGIGGDAYKGYLIKKKFEVKTKKIVSVLLLDRLSGLLLLFVYACILAFFLDQPVFNAYKALIAPLVLLGILVFWLINKRFFGFVFPVFWSSVGYSAGVQLAQLISAWSILMALDVPGQWASYLFVFLISSIVAILPLTVGGIGSREVTFYYFSLWLGLEQDISITISMVFFLITAFTSLGGIIYHFKKPDLKKNS
ncbi:lysylphosphatidylglycerol synthase transmembrane domain-containing protein [Pseudozobellia thermophila]|uniref:Lysylphosphatidylglycerol synthase TM region n=1 Tax=Pseudozobellia thermophila TaxID=192903 RepID=A0A1M6HYR8_9FLAO|nr:lysylphosphatidylglycerol synthase transmembrane domain-containing protein [Pseudozobellia thermophila]SHJ27338.1 hypothetical protein SAMN04488513_103247 [Pseudozobellia thermophila]